MKALNSLVGTGALIRLILRRDRIVLLAWVVGFALLVIGVAAAVPGTYPTAQARQAFASETSGNPTEIMTLGPIFDSSIGGSLRGACVGGWRWGSGWRACSLSSGTPVSRRSRDGASSWVRPWSVGMHP